MSLVVDPYQLLALRCAIGLFGGFGPMTASLVTIGAPQAEVGTAIGKLQAVQIGATAIGPLIGGVVADTLGIRVSFWVTAGLCLAAFGLITLLYREEREEAAARKVRPRLPMRAILALPGFFPLMAILLLAQLVDRSFSPIIPLFVHELAPAAPVASASGAVFTAGSLISALAASQVGRVLGRRPAPVLLAASLAVGMAAIAPLVAVDALWQLIVLRAVFGLAAGTTATLAYAAATALVPDESRATAFGFLGSATSLATAAGPFGAGAIASVSLRTAFVVDAALYAVAVALAVALAARRGRPA
jgi:MFS family permease